MTVDPVVASQAPILYIVLAFLAATGAGLWAVARWAVEQEHKRQIEVLEWQERQNSKWMQFLSDCNNSRESQNAKRDEILSRLVDRVSAMEGSVAGVTSRMDTQHAMINRMADYVRGKTGELKSP